MAAANGSHFQSGGLFYGSVEHAQGTPVKCLSTEK